MVISVHTSWRKTRRLYELAQDWKANSRTFDSKISAHPNAPRMKVYQGNDLNCEGPQTMTYLHENL